VRGRVGARSACAKNWAAWKEDTLGGNGDGMPGAQSRCWPPKLLAAALEMRAEPLVPAGLSVHRCIARFRGPIPPSRSRVTSHETIFSRLPVDMRAATEPLVKQASGGPFARSHCPCC
jgi:hypothetical protein